MSAVQKYIGCLLALLLLTCCVAGCRRTNQPVSDTEFLLNTSVTLRIYAIDGSSGKGFTRRAEALIQDCFEKCRDYQDIFSRTASTSELFRLNQKQSASPGTPSLTVPVSSDLASLLEIGLYYSELSQGAFDITTAPLSDLWDFSAAKPQVPRQEDIQEALASVDYRNLILEGNSVTFLNPDTQIDLGAIAKGYIADQMASWLRQEGVTSAILDLGGNLYCIGGRSKNQPFTVGIRDPFSDSGTSILTLSVQNLSVVSSGIYERCFTQDGQFYHHILNPKTGYPYDNGLASVTILSGSSTHGDALSTTCFALGLENGIALLDSLPDTWGIFITTDGEIHFSEGAKAYLKS